MGGLITAVVVAAVTAAVTVVVTRHIAAARDTPAAPARHGPPVKIDSVTVMRTETQAGLYVFQRTVDLSRSELHSLNQLRHGPGDDAWFRSRGGVDPSPSNVQLVVEGNADQLVRITNLTLIKNCHAPLDGTLFDDPPGGGQPALPINFNLDSPQALAFPSPAGSVWPHFYPAWPLRFPADARPAGCASWDLSLSSPPSAQVIACWRYPAGGRPPNTQFGGCQSPVSA